MPLLHAVAHDISNNQLVAGVIEEIITEESLYALLPFTQVNGKAYVYNRETKLADSNFLQPNADITDEASLFKSVTTHLKILIGDVDVDKFIDATESDTNSQKAIQIAMKAKGMGRRFKDALVNGGTTRDNPNNPGTNLTGTNEFDGIRKIWRDGIDSTAALPYDTAAQAPDAAASGNQTMTGGWEPFWRKQIIMMDPSQAVNITDATVKPEDLSYAAIDELVDAIPYSNADCIMMSKAMYRKYKALLRASGGITPDMIMIKNFGMVPAHDGTPIIMNDYLPTITGASNVTYQEIYALRLNEVDGLHGLYGGGNAGIVVEDIGTVQNRDSTRTRLKWYCGLALKSTRSLAVLRGVKIVRD